MRNGRHIQIALVFVWALAHGMWMGAVWHSAAASHANPAAPQANCFCQRFAAEANTDCKLTAATPAGQCGVCALGTLAPEAPVHFVCGLPEVHRPFAAPATYLSAPRDNQSPLPFGRGPPSLA